MKNWSRYSFIILFCVLIYSLFVSSVPLLDPDEPVYGETAKEMIAFGDFLSPRIYGEFWYDKPPLFYWAEAISFSLFGVSDFTARLPSIFFGTLTPLSLYYKLKDIFSEKIAFMSALICASSLEIVILARSSVTDTLLTFTLTVALISFLRKEYVLAYSFCGLALLAKGPIGFGFPALIVGIWMILTKQFNLKSIMALKWTWGIPLACLVGLPWYIQMGIIHGDAFIDTFLGYHNVTRFVSPEHAGKNHYWLYMVVLLAGFFPWAGTIGGILLSVKKWMKNKETAFFFVWAAFIFIFFSLSSTQLFSYILPMFPPLSVLAAKYLNALFETEASKTAIAGLWITNSIVAIALTLQPYRPIGGAAVLYGLSFLLLALTTVTIYFLYKKRANHFFYGNLALSLVLVCSIWSLFSTPVSSNFTSKEIARKVAATSLDPTVPVYIDPFYRPSVAFYTDIYGNALPNFDPKKKEVIKQNEEKGVLLPGQEEKTLPDTCYILVQKKLFDAWPKEQKEHVTLLWQKDTAYFFKKEASR